MIIYGSLPGLAYLVQTIKNVTDSSDKLVKMSETADKILTYVTKVTGVSPRCGWCG
jgi:cysteinyl-tRNA synthetase